MRVFKEAEHGGEQLVSEARPPTATSEAREMLSLFASVGAHHFDVTLKDERTDEISFDRDRTVNGLITSLPSLLSRSAREQIDIIIRPHSKTPLIQLDDLAPAAVERVKEFSFAVIETSRGNFQVWIAVTDANEDTARQLKLATGADAGASGAVRVCGTKNHKKEHAPDFPTVRLIESQPGRTATLTDLQAAKLLKKTEEPRAARSLCPSRFRPRTWPDYGRCLRDAPARKSSDGTDTSRADWQFALLAADRGFTAEEITVELLNVSEKAKRNGRRYAVRTAERAVWSVSKNKK